MKKDVIILGVILLVLISSGCIGGTTETTSSKPAREKTPSEVVEAYAEALQRKDYDKMYDFMSEEFKNSNTLAGFERWFNNLDVAYSQSVAPSFGSVLNEKISGNQATIDYEYILTTPEGYQVARDGSVTLVKEETGWKFTERTDLT